MAPEVRKVPPSFRDSFLLLHQVGHIDKLHTRLWTSTRSSLFLHLLQFALSQHDAYPTRQPGRAEGQGRERTNRVSADCECVTAVLTTRFSVALVPILGGLAFVRQETTTPYYTQWLRSGFHPLVPIESEENRQRREQLAAAIDPIIRSYTICSKLGDDNWVSPYLPKISFSPFNALAIARTGLLTLSGSAYTLEQEFWRVAEEAAEEARIAPYKALLLSKPGKTVLRVALSCTEMM